MGVNREVSWTSSAESYYPKYPGDLNSDKPPDEKVGEQTRAVELAAMRRDPTASQGTTLACFGLHALLPLYKNACFIPAPWTWAGKPQMTACKLRGQAD